MDKAFHDNSQERRRFYKKAVWRRLRLRQLKKSPLCEICWRDYKKQTVAKVCDHIDPTWETWTEFLRGPFQSLCRACHDEKTQTKDSMLLSRKAKFKIRGIEYAKTNH